MLWDMNRRKKCYTPGQFSWVLQSRLILFLMPEAFPSLLQK